MYLKIKNQKEIIKELAEKVGGYRKLAKLIKIPKSSLFEYSKGRLIPEDKYQSIKNFSRADLVILEKLPNNWKQIKGGKRLIEIKKEKGTFNKEMKKWQDFQAKKLKKWHKFMKTKKPDEYYNLQYSRFKKIAEYKYTTLNGEKVRNILEKEAADTLYNLGIKYQYEPLIHIGKDYFFPDFLIGKNIIECTMWKGVEKAYKLKDKIDILKKQFKVYVLIPKGLYSYYKTLNYHLILGLDELVPVAQTFKNIEGSNR